MTDLIYFVVRISILIVINILKLNNIFEAILILATTLLLSYIFKTNYDTHILNFVFKLLLISAENSPGCAGSKNVKTPCLLFYFILMNLAKIIM